MDWKGICEITLLLCHIHEHYAEDLSLEDYAKTVGYSSHHVQTIFQSYLGQTMGSYLRELRMIAALEYLEEGRSVSEVGKMLSFSSESGFRRRFKNHYGISPKAFLMGEKPAVSYLKRYEYRSSARDTNWGTGENPTPDGLWEFDYYDPETDEYRKMHWSEIGNDHVNSRENVLLPDSGLFEAPYEKAHRSDRSWYCLHRFWGYGMHPGKAVQSVRTFISPHSGVLEITLSAGRICELYKGDTPCSLHLRQNGVPLPSVEEPYVLSDTKPLHLKEKISVKKGDRISLHLDSMDNIHCDGIMIYRQRMDFLEIDEE